MRHKNLFLVLFCLVFCAGPAHAGIVNIFTIVTSPLEGDPAAPFSLDFQLNDGSGTGDGNNTAMLSGFTFGAGGGPSGSLSLAGGATGDLGSAVSITDNSFLNEFTQGFTPGSLLQFQLALTTNVDDGGTPDQFSLAILDSGGNQLPTLSFSDVLVEIDIDSTNPTVQTFASDPSRDSVGGGGPIDLDAPTYVSVSSTPEPGSISMMGCGLGIIALRIRACGSPDVKRSRQCRMPGGIGQAEHAFIPVPLSEPLTEVIERKKNTMGLSVCPIAVAATPVELVWANLVQRERYFDWADVQAAR